MWDGVDRRRFPRAEYPCLIKMCKNVPPSQAILTHTENISIGGVRVIIPQKIEVMAEIELEIDLMDTFPTITSLGMISWAKEIAPGSQGKPRRYDIGVRFIALKDEHRRRIENIVEHLISKSR